jgi:3'-5' exonuclease
VPDIRWFAAANDLVGKSDAEVREAIEEFPKRIYHSIICIRALVAHWETDHWAVDAVGAPPAPAVPSKGEFGMMAPS